MLNAPKPIHQRVLLPTSITTVLPQLAAQDTGKTSGIEPIPKATYHKIKVRVKQQFGMVQSKR